MQPAPCGMLSRAQWKSLLSPHLTPSFQPAVPQGKTRLYLGIWGCHPDFNTFVQLLEYKVCVHNPYSNPNPIQPIDVCIVSTISKMTRRTSLKYQSSIFSNEHNLQIHFILLNPGLANYVKFCNEVLEGRFQNTKAETSLQEAGSAIAIYFMKCILNGLKHRIVDYESRNSIKDRCYFSTACCLQVWEYHIKPNKHVLISSQKFKLEPV